MAGTFGCPSFFWPPAWGTLDPVIRSASLAYENGPIWAAIAWQDHSDWAASSLSQPNIFETAMPVGAGDVASPGIDPNAADGDTKDRSGRQMASSDAEGWRYAARYIHTFTNGASASLALMYENLEHEFTDANDIRDALSAFGLPSQSNARLPTQANSGSDLGSFFDTDNNEFTGGLGGDVSFERSAWMVSSKVDFAGPWDLRFSYAEADDIDLDCYNCPTTWTGTGAEAWNLGAFYTMPAGTELRVTYSKLKNDVHGTYFQAVNGTAASLAEGNRTGAEVETIALGLVHWFD